MVLKTITELSSFTGIYASGASVRLSAPSLFNGHDFIKWVINGQEDFNTAIPVIMKGNQTVIAYYESSNPPEIAINRKSLSVGYIIGGNHLATETFTVFNSGGGTLNWHVSTEMFRIGLSPTSGTNKGKIEVTLNPKEPGQLNSGKY